jgi:hypothetical protein
MGYNRALVAVRHLPFHNAVVATVPLDTASSHAQRRSRVKNTADSVGMNVVCSTKGVVANGEATS